MTEFARTRAAIESGLRERLHLGAQLYVSRGGQVLIDEAFGEAREGVPMRGDSITLWFSAGKPLTAAAIAQLIERGALQWDTPVVQVISEFAQNGKERVTVRHLLTHTAGLRNADSVEEAMDNDTSAPPGHRWRARLAWICAQPLEPNWQPGERAGYHVTGTWYVLGEIIARVTGKACDDFLRSELFSKFGMSTTSLALKPEEIRAFGDRIAFVYNTSSGTPQAKADWNNEEGFMRCRPGGSARGPLRELGRFYEALLNHGDGALQPQTVELVTSRQRTGLFDETFQFKMDWGLGFILNSNRDGFQMPYSYGRYASADTFGHSGNQASCAFADPGHQLVVAWVCNGMPGERKHQQRQRAINNAVYEDLGLAKS
jgi:CubicO group peptidase (beta-lactamase class C family)